MLMGQIECTVPGVHCTTRTVGAVQCARDMKNALFSNYKFTMGVSSFLYFTAYSSTNTHMAECVHLNVGHAKLPKTTIKPFVTLHTKIIIT